MLKILRKIGVTLASGGFCTDPEVYEQQKRKQFLQDCKIAHRGNILEKFGLLITTGGFSLFYPEK